MTDCRPDLFRLRRVPTRGGPLVYRLLNLLERRTQIHLCDLYGPQTQGSARRRAAQIMRNAGMIPSRYCWHAGPTTLDWMIVTKRRKLLAEARKQQTHGASRGSGVARSVRPGPEMEPPAGFYPPPEAQAARPAQADG
jgi:hypothetical protein